MVQEADQLNFANHEGQSRLGGRYKEQTDFSVQKNRKSNSLQRIQWNWGALC